MLFNANLDRSSRTRKSKSELRKELKKWEEEKTKRKKNLVEDEVAHEVRNFLNTMRDIHQVS
jgi:E3 ubiquitin-protein ligase RAD18